MSHTNGAPLALTLDAEALRPLVRVIVQEVLQQYEAARTQTGERLAYSEPEAAAMLGLEVHQLRDERLRGRIAASSIVGRRIRYLAVDLQRYLAERRTEASAGPRD